MFFRREGDQDLCGLQALSVSVEDIKLFIKEAANAGGLKVAGHVQTRKVRAAPLKRASGRLSTYRAHRRSAQADGAEGHLARGHRNSVDGISGTQAAFDRTVAGMKSAWATRSKWHFRRTPIITSLV